MAWLPKKRVVVPIDLSDFSLKALDEALEIVDTPEHIHVIQVLREMSAMEPGVVWGDVTDETRKKHAEDSIHNHLKDEKYNNINATVLFGNPPKKIAEFAQDIEAELIVIHSHGHTGPKHVFIGSTAERVVRLAHCAVLVLRD